MALLWTASWSACASLLASATQRPWAPTDSLDVRYVSLRPDASTVWFLDGRARQQVVTPSPSGDYFFVLTHHGELESDSTVVELRVYSVEAVKAWLRVPAPEGAAPPQPFRRVALRSYSSDLIPAINNAQWDAGGSGIFFMGMTEAGLVQVHRLDIRSGELEQLTDHPAGVTEFHTRGDGLLFKVQSQSRDYQYTYPVTVFPHNGTRAIELEFGRTNEKTYVLYRGSKATELSPHYRDVFYRRERISPDGRIAIGLYWGPGGLEQTRQPLSILGKQQFVAVDLENGRFLPPVLKFGRPAIPGTEHYISPEVFWSRDSTRAILTAAVPDWSKSPFEQTSYLVEYEPRSGKWKILEPLFEPSSTADGRTRPRKYITSVGWMKSGEELVVTHEVDGKADEGTIYSFTPSGVASRPAKASVTVAEPSSAQLLRGLSVALRQGANEPPQLVASDERSRRDLLGADPALSSVSVARSKPFQWRESGITVTGGLTLPVGFTAGQRVPVVIQGYRYTPELFLPDGQTRTPSEARQALAARGLAVLEIDILDSSAGFPKPLSADRFVERIDTAVEALVREGIVDPARVGVSGFSRGGYLTYYAITHPSRTRVKAAICADSWRGDYPSYLTAGSFGGMRGPIRETEQGVGGKPFWEDRPAWLEKEPSFNVDRVDAATLFTLHGGYGVSHLEGIATIGAFMLNRKPVEYLYFPDGDHQLQRPLERLAMMEATVDWMTFWLQGYEDPAPHKAAQYTRWRAMRDHKDTSRS